MGTVERRPGGRPSIEDRVGALLAAAARRWPDRECLRFGVDRLTFADLAARVDAVAADMVARGVKAGDRVLVQLPNSIEALVLQLAAFQIGAVDVPVVAIYRGHEARAIVADTRPAVVAATHVRGDQSPTADLDRIFDDLGHTPLARYGLGDVRRDGWSSVPLPGDQDTDAPPGLFAPGDPDECCMIMYTSGTTRDPKGVRLSSRALHATATAWSRRLPLDQTSVFFVGTPIAHVSGFITAFLAPVTLGARSVVMARWDGAEAARLIDEERATLMNGTALFLQDLCDRYERADAPAHRLTYFQAGGAALTPEVILRAEKAGITAFRVYGMTEAAGNITMAPPDAPVERRSQWDGLVLEGTELQAIDEFREPLPPGESGEIRFRGPQMLMGYTDPELTRAQIDGEGWFYPGDIGVVDTEGWFRFDGRTKDIINRGGEKFSALEIESLIARHPDIEEAAVVAIPDSRFGEAVGAFVVLRKGVPANELSWVVRFLDEQGLAKQKLPTELHAVDGIPVSPAGKIQKFRLLEARNAKVDDAQGVVQ